MDKRIDICLVGFGNAGKAFCRMLSEKSHEVEMMRGYEIKVVAIATRSKGCHVDHEGLDLTKVISDVEKNGRFDEKNPMIMNLGTLSLIKESKADVMIEMSALSIEDGQPAIQHIETAFSQNMHVITANKGPIAWDYKRLMKEANERNLQFLYETTVMDGTPIFNLAKYALPGCKVKSFKGILNSTTNFIIEEMEKGNSYDEAVREAQRRGFAEADPKLDVEGWDAAAKTTALANVLMDAELTPIDIEREGIENIAVEDIEKALKNDKKIKLLCEGYRENGRVYGRVKPTLVDKSDLFAAVDATSSVLSITTDLMGEVVVLERNPEIQQTAYGIYSDLLTLLNHL
ncbi:MAG: homoserine dehydrogenase [Bacillota bacterium]|nr:homoserine dehydrogenase [Bacillota bacterium]